MANDEARDVESDLNEGLLSEPRSGGGNAGYEGGRHEGGDKDVEAPPGGIFRLKASMLLALPSLLVGTLALVSFAPIFPGILERWFTACDLDHDPECKCVLYGIMYLDGSRIVSCMNG